MLHSKLLSTQFFCLPQLNYLIIRICILYELSVNNVNNNCNIINYLIHVSPFSCCLAMAKAPGCLWILSHSMPHELTLLREQIFAPEVLQLFPYSNMFIIPYSSRMIFLTQIDWVDVSIWNILSVTEWETWIIYYK